MYILAKYWIQKACIGQRSLTCFLGWVINVEVDDTFI